jgi:homoserine/homoserine lactone efflux protein
MNWETWSLFVATETVLCLTPGPAVLLVLSQALRWGPRASVWANTGILSANAFYFFLSATSLGAILLASYDLFFAVKWAGAAYLIYLGIRTFHGASSPLAAGPSDTGVHGCRMFANAFAVQASNPKSLLFFGALLPQFIDPKRDVVTQILILGVTSIVLEFAILLGYGILAGSATNYARLPRFARWTNRISGGLLIGAGAGLATLRRS